MVSPAPNATSLTGRIAVSISLSAVSSGYSWNAPHVEIRDSGGFIAESGYTTLTGSTSAVYNWDTSLI